MRLWIGVCGAAVLLCAAWAPPARASGGDAGVAFRGLNRAVAANRLSQLDARQHRAQLRFALRTLARLPASRRAPLRAVLRDVAAQAPRYDGPRTLSLFATLELNARFLLRSRLPRPGDDVTDGLGVVYRSVPGRGLRFHPLASFGRLNAEVTAGRPRRATVLGYALLARARSSRRMVTWEYDYRAAGGRPPWTSGMVQAVAAQALARAGLVPESRRAFAAVPHMLVTRGSVGPWIRLYAFSGVAVLNAQLQAALSLEDYARIAGDPSAKRLAARMRRAARKALPRFDTGYWSLYALDGNEAPLSYHQYVTSLLWKLARRTGDRAWADQAAQFRDDWRKPPAVRRLAPAPPSFPWPRDGFRDAVPIRFWLSKPAQVRVAVAGEEHSYRLPPGRRTVMWRPGKRGPGRYDIEISAVDRVGNRTDSRLAPAVVARDTTPPRVATSVAGSRVGWRARDSGTPWVTVELELKRGGTTRVLRMPRRRHFAGARELRLRRPWHAELSVCDSSGNETTVGLGRIGPAVRVPAVPGLED